MNVPLSLTLREKGLSLTGFAKRMSINKSTATRWAQKRVPAERVLEAERVTGVSRHELRPDLYPPPVPDHLLPQVQSAHA